MNTFWGYLRCYIFLCKVADYISEETKRVFEDWETKDGKAKFQERGSNTCAKTVWQYATWPQLESHNLLHNLGGSDSGGGQDVEPLEMEDGKWS